MPRGSLNENIIFKSILNKMCVEWTQLAQDKIEYGFRAHNDENLGSIKCAKFIYQLSNHKLSKIVSTPRK